MSDRASTVERDGDALFVKDGTPVKFCFHASAEQGRRKISRDIERHGGQVVADERRANVLLIDEEQNIALFRRRYYSSNKQYRLSLYIEPRGFVRKCIRSGQYYHVKPIKRGMPGRPAGSDKGRVRVPFTEEDRDHLAHYLATILPTRDGRMGNKAYKDLVLLGQTADPEWVWARRHTFHSWREHYKINADMMDEKINYHLEQLRGVGHHMGEDMRRHNRREAREEEEEEEEESEGEGEGESEEGEEEGEQRRGGDSIEGESEDEEAVVIQEPQSAKRQRGHSDAHLHDIQEAQAKRQRVSNEASNEARAAGVEAGRDESDSEHEDSDNDESPDLEGSDLFGDHDCEDEMPFEFDLDQEFEFPAPYSPVASPVPELDGAPLSTQATLIASPLATQKEKGKEKEPISVPGLTPTKSVEARVPAPEPTAPPSSQPTVVASPERVVVPRGRVRGASAQPGPSVPKESRSRVQTREGGDAMADAPYRNTRARSRSADPQPQPAPESWRPRQREVKGGKGKGKAREETLVAIEEDVPVEEGPREVELDVAGEVESVALAGGGSTRETFEDEMAVEGLLEASLGSEVDLNEDVDDEAFPALHEDSEDEGEVVGDSDADEEDMPELPPFLEEEDGIEPTDSDDAETHEALVRGVVGGDANSTSRGPDWDRDRDQDLSEDEESEDEDADADRIERMARGSLHATPAPMPLPLPLPLEPRVTRSMTATQVQAHAQTRTQPSSRQIQPEERVRTRAVPATSAFPSAGTKARAVVDHVREGERREPYKPPAGSQAAEAVKGRGGRQG